jgi:hypothetical protein
MHESWTDSEIARFQKREAAFIKNGLGIDDAEKLAETMLYRDRPDEGDDRRLCFECKHFAPEKCRNGQALNPFVMQRCPWFELRG